MTQMRRTKQRVSRKREDARDNKEVDDEPRRKRNRNKARGRRCETKVGSKWKWRIGSTRGKKMRKS